MNRVKDYYSKKNVDFNINVEDIVKKPVKSGGKNNSGVIVKGIENCLIKFARCCNPVPGDEIVGYITRGRGVSVHRKDCSSVFNIEKNEEDRNRLISVEWDKEDKKGVYNTELLVTANDRAGLLVDVTLVLNDFKIPIRAVNAKTTKDNLCMINVTLEIDTADKLSKAIGKMKTIKDVIDVTRTNK